jgi:hypothetical protein
VLSAYGFDGCGGFDDDRAGRRLQSSAAGAGPQDAGAADGWTLCKADTNNDGLVNVEDLMEVLAVEPMNPLVSSE